MNLNFFKKPKPTTHENTCIKVCMYCRNVNYNNEETTCTKCGRNTINMMAVECYECKKTWLQKPKRGEDKPNVALYHVKCPARGEREPVKIFTEPPSKHPQKWKHFYEITPFIDRLF